MTYSARLKVTCDDKLKIKRLTYEFVNETTGSPKSTNGKNGIKLDSNNCTKVYNCNKSDLVKFYLYIDHKLHMMVKVKPQINGNFNDSKYHLPSEVKNKNGGQNRNKNGNAVYVPYRNSTNIVTEGSTQTRNNDTKQTKNKEKSESLETMQDVAGYSAMMITGAKVYDKNTFHWGLMHKNAPIVSKETFQNFTSMKMYSYNRDSNRVFQGNQHVKVEKLGKAIDKLDKNLVGPGGDILDGVEIYQYIKDGDEKKLASKGGEVLGEKAGEAVGVKLAGVCGRTAIKEVLNPKKAFIIGGSCAVAYHYSGNKLGGYAGKAMGETDTGEQVAIGVLEAIEKLDKMDEEAYEKERKKMIEKDPMLEWHILGAD